MKTSEGFYYTADHKLHRGLECSAVISPRRNIPSSINDLFDVIVIGAGYAGLTSCRDLCTSGYRVLLLEARSRVGGRVFTAKVDGHDYEMGGTWIHWNQPYTYREISRYGMTDWASSKNDTIGCKYFTLSVDGISRNITHEEMNTMASKAFSVLCNMDGRNAKQVMPFPHAPYSNPEVKKWDIPVSERLEQIRSLLSCDETALLQAFIAAISGNDMQSTGFLDILHWWALCGYSVEGLYEHTETFKMRSQSDFARCFFTEAIETGNLSYSFDTWITRIEEQANANRAVVHDAEGNCYLARRVICTVPLNVLSKITFEPPLSEVKALALKSGHIGLGAKIHVEVRGDKLRSWGAAAWPSSGLISCVGDGLTGTGNTHLVCFASTRHFKEPKDDAVDMMAEMRNMHSMEIEKVVWHNWVTDPLSCGTWCVFPPRMGEQHLSALQERHGRIIFASGDWASGWRGFIDGAIGQGTTAAKTISSELESSRRSRAAL